MGEEQQTEIAGIIPAYEVTLGELTSRCAAAGVAEIDARSIVVADEDMPFGRRRLVVVTLVLVGLRVAMAAHAASEPVRVQGQGVTLAEAFLHAIENAEGVSVEGGVR